MKRAPFFITTAIVLIAAGGYLLYDKILKHERVSPWSLVPEDAVMVYESTSCTECINTLSNSTLWKIIERAIQYQKPQDSLRHAVHGLLKPGAGHLISLHVTKKDDFDVVYYLPGFDALPATIGRNGKYRIRNREFNKVNIIELSDGRQTLSTTFIGDVWVVSFAPFLLEDVIRTYTDESRKGFRELSKGTPSFATIRDDAGNIHFQLRLLTEFLSVFTGPASSSLKLPLAKFTVLDARASETSLVMNGFSVDTTSSRSQFLLSVFNHQSPVSFGLKHLISNRTVAVKSYGVTDGDAFSVELKRFGSLHNRSMTDSLVRLTASLQDPGKLLSTIADEFAVCSLESSRGDGVSQVLLVESSDPAQWLNTMDNLSDRFSLDTVFHERYSDYEIREVPIFRFPEKLLWPFVTGFDQAFYTSIGNVILIGDNLESLKDFLADIEDEETWARSVRVNRFLESTLLESNVSLYVDATLVWSSLMTALQPKWQHFVTENRRLLQGLQMCAFQFSHLNNNFYTNALFTFRPFDESLQPAEKQRLIVNFEYGLQELYPVRSHVNRTTEILVQDSINDLRLISADGKIQWKLPIGDKIVGEVAQIDFYNNGKLQYFFATRNRLHVIDRLGNYVESYPKDLVDVEIEQTSVVDYDNSKNYRFLVADNKGRIWMFDKHGRNLEGWQPKDAGGRLAMSPRHHRIKGRDFIVAIRADGKVVISNRRGETLKGFPLDINARPIGDYFLEIGSTLAESNFILVSDDGYRIRFNTDGEVVAREALVKTSALAEFSLIREKSAKSYLILQQDGRQLHIFDDNGKRLLSNPTIHVSSDDVQYLDFGAGKRFILISDKRQRFCYVYDGQGQLLTLPPHEGHAVDVRPDDSDRFQVYFINGKTLTIRSL